MSWSYSKNGPVKEVKDDFKAYIDANPLAEPEQGIREKAKGCLDRVESTLGRDFPVSIVAYGSQTTVDGQVTSFNDSITLNGGA